MTDWAKILGWCAVLVVHTACERLLNWGYENENNEGTLMWNNDGSEWKHREGAITRHLSLRASQWHEWETEGVNVSQVRIIDAATALEIIRDASTNRGGTIKRAFWIPLDIE